MAPPEATLISDQDLFLFNERSHLRPRAVASAHGLLSRDVAATPAW